VLVEVDFDAGDASNGGVDACVLHQRVAELSCRFEELWHVGGAGVREPHGDEVDVKRWRCSCGGGELRFGVCVSKALVLRGGREVRGACELAWSPVKR